MSEPTSSSRQDVVICGGGFAGLLLARHLRRELPELSVTVIDRMARPLPDAAHKVGESSVELGCQYLESLGLKDYLLDQHLVKLGLRFFPGGGELPLHERLEIGPMSEPPVRSYQMDRGKIENDLRAMNAEHGVTMIEGAKVEDIELATDGGEHLIRYAGSAAGEVRARWVVDATGRQALLRRRMKITRGSPHKSHASWFRVRGKVDIADMVPRSETEWHERPCASERWRSTNHLMGHGYWAWVIPLSTGHTSIGLVVHDDPHGTDPIQGLDKTMAFLREHEPHLAAHLENYEVVDFLCLKDFSHNVARCWSPDRWALVGEAGAFVDPFYSPGTDFIATANHFTVEMIRTDLRGENLQEKATHLNLLYRSLFNGCCDLYKNAQHVYDHPSAMSAKLFWDNLLYWSFTCHLVHQNVYRLSPTEYQPYGEIGTRFLELGSFMQRFFAAWAELAPEEPRPGFVSSPPFPSILVDAHVSTGERYSLEETLAMMRERLQQGELAVGELVMRAVQTVGPELAKELLARSGWREIQVQITPHRLEGEAKVGRARRAHLSNVARDVERMLGRLERHPEAGKALELLSQSAAV